MSPIPLTLVGATGLTGSTTLTSLLNTKKQSFSITTIARKAINPAASLNSETTYTHNLVSDLFEAPKDKVAEENGIYVSCLGTTRATAGGIQEQEKLDLHLNRDLAQRAKEDGAKTVNPFTPPESEVLTIRSSSFRLLALLPIQSCLMVG